MNCKLQIRSSALFILISLQFSNETAFKISLIFGRMFFLFLSLFFLVKFIILSMNRLKILFIGYQLTIEPIKMISKEDMSFYAQ